MDLPYVWSFLCVGMMRTELGVDSSYVFGLNNKLYKVHGTYIKIVEA